MSLLNNLKEEYQKQAAHQEQLQPGSPEFKKAARFQALIAIIVGLAFALGGGVSWYLYGSIPRIALAFAITLPALGLYSLVTGKKLGKK